MNTIVKGALLTLLLASPLAMAGDIDTKDVRDYLDVKTGHMDTMDQINREIEAQPTAAGKMDMDSMHKEQAKVPGTLDVRFSPNLLFAPGTAQGDL